MITVTTTPSVMNNLTPMTEGVVNNSVAGIAAIPNVDFTNALNAQLTTASAKVVTAPILDETALLTATIASENDQTPTALATQQTAVATTVLTAQQTELVSSETSMLLTANKSIALANASMPDIAITSEDSEILSNVTDTLKFIATGAKLGDTLPAGQAVRLQNVNTSIPLTQQTVQAAVKQSVNTPVTVLVQQAMPTQTSEILTNPQAQIQPVEKLGEIAVLDVQNKIAITVDTKKTTIEPVISNQAQTVQIEMPVVTATPIQAQTVQSENSVGTLVQTQTVQAEKPVATTTSVQVQTVHTEKPVVVTATLVQTKTAQMEKSVVTATSAQAQTVQLEQNAEISAQIEKPVVTGTLAQAVQPEKTVLTATAQTQTVQTGKTVVTATTEERQNITVGYFNQETKMVENGMPMQSVMGEISVQHLQNESVVKNMLKNNEPVNIDESVQNEESLIVQSSPIFVQNESVITVAISEKPTDKSAEQQNFLQEERVLETPLPLVTAQVAPIQVEADVATFDTPSSSTLLEDKPTLTPAKNLLADVLANRNNSGDTANNSGDKKGSDTPANSASLLADSTAKNALDNKAFETKSFTSLLNAEKAETSSALSATINDKVAPQVATAAVNKLTQDMKADVPALTRPLSHPNWNQDVGERIIWMNNRGISSAEIRMNPQNMGSITVRIDVDSTQQASVSFMAQNAEVRTALEASIPRLREMLSSQNLNLADVNVSQQSSTSADSNSSQRQNPQMTADASASGQGNRQSNQEVDTNGNPIRQVDSNGEEIMVDEFVNGQVIEGNGANGLLSIFA